MKQYLGLDNAPVLNGQYKLLKSIDYLTELIGIANYKNGILDGEQFRLDKEGLIMDIDIYENGKLIEQKNNVKSDRFVDTVVDETKGVKRTGKYILFTHNETSIFTLKSGMFEGAKWIYHDSENIDKPILLSIENFVDNHHVGEQVFFHEDGKVMLIEYYASENSSLPEKSTWFDYDENGNLLSERNFRKNKKDGRHIFYENNRLIKDISYREGKLFGPSIYYREDGTKLIIDYEFGFKVGERIE